MWLILLVFTARAMLALQCSHCKRCISYSNSVCPSVHPSVRPSHDGIVSKRRHVARCGLHRWITPFPQIDIIGAVVIVWRVRRKTIRSVLCNIVYNNCAQCNAHTYEQTNSSLDWVLTHWAHFTVLRFIFACIMCIIVYCVHV